MIEEVEHPKPRASVMRFAERMEIQLRANEHRGGWHNKTQEYLWLALDQNVRELKKPLTKEHYERTCADVGNFAMMLLDKEIFPF